MIRAHGSLLRTASPQHHTSATTGPCVGDDSASCYGSRPVLAKAIRPRPDTVPEGDEAPNAVVLARRPEEPDAEVLRYTSAEKLALGGVAAAAVVAFPQTSLLITAGTVLVSGTLAVGMVRGLRGVPIPKAKPLAPRRQPLAVRPRAGWLSRTRLSSDQRKLVWVTFALPVILLSMTGAQLLVWGVPMYLAARLVAAVATRLRPSLAY